MTKKRWLWIIMAGALVLSACGGDDDDSETGSPTATDTEADDEATDEPTDDDMTDDEMDDEGDGEAAANPTVTVEPSSGLSDGDTVTVIGEGYTPGTQLGINQCADASDPDHGIEQTGAAHCNLQAIMPVQADDEGRVEAEYTVSGGPFGEAQVVCDAEHDCVLSLGELTAEADAERATVTITFA